MKTFWAAVEPTPSVVVTNTCFDRWGLCALIEKESERSQTVSWESGRPRRPLCGARQVASTEYYTSLEAAAAFGDLALGSSRALAADLAQEWVSLRWRRLDLEAGGPLLPAGAANRGWVSCWSDRIEWPKAVMRDEQHRPAAMQATVVGWRSGSGHSNLSRWCWARVVHRAEKLITNFANNAHRDAPCGFRYDT